MHLATVDASPSADVLSSLAAAPLALVPSPAFPDFRRAPSAEPLPLDDETLELAASVMASLQDIDYDPVRAADLPISWYRAALTPEYCSEVDAGAIRLMVIERCKEERRPVLATLTVVPREHVPLAKYDAKDLIVRDSDRDGHIIGVCVVIALLAAMFVYWLVSPTDRELREMSFGRVSAVQVGR